MPGSKRTIRSIDWNEYSRTFPLHYVDISSSDVTMKWALSKEKPGRAVDVGGGVNGTSYLIDWADDYVLLDPFVKSKLLAITWEDLFSSCAHGNFFDVVLARGAINYLGHAGQIPILAGAVAKGGLFIFNTFINPPSDKMERRYTSKTGNGIERAELVPGGPFGKVMHELIPDDEDYTIIHKFYYYPISFFKEVIGDGEEFDCKVYKSNNSAVFVCKRK